MNSSTVRRRRHAARRLAWRRAGLSGGSSGASRVALRWLGPVLTAPVRPSSWRPARRSGRRRPSGPRRGRTAGPRRPPILLKLCNISWLAVPIAVFGSVAVCGLVKIFRNMSNCGLLVSVGSDERRLDRRHVAEPVGELRDRGLVEREVLGKQPGGRRIERRPSGSRACCRSCSRRRTGRLGVVDRASARCRTELGAVCLMNCRPPLAVDLHRQLALSRRRSRARTPRRPRTGTRSLLSP